MASSYETISASPQHLLCPLVLMGSISATAVATASNYLRHFSESVSCHGAEATPPLSPLWQLQLWPWAFAFREYLSDDVCLLTATCTDYFLLRFFSCFSWFFFLFFVISCFVSFCFFVFFFLYHFFHLIIFLFVVFFYVSIYGIAYLQAAQSLSAPSCTACHVDCDATPWVPAAAAARV